MAVTTFPVSSLRVGGGYYTDIIGGGIGSVVVTTGGGSVANVGDPSGRNDDGFRGPIDLGFTFRLFGVDYTQFWANNNGNISFVGGLAVYIPTGPSVALYPIIAPFFSDVDTRNAASGVMHLRTDIPNQVIVTWESVGYFNNHGDKLNSFQLVIRGPGYAIPAGEGPIGMYWRDMQWETTDTVHFPSIGFGDGAGNSVEMEGSLSPGLYSIVANHYTWFNLFLVPVPPPTPPAVGTVYGDGFGSATRGTSAWGGHATDVPSGGAIQNVRNPDLHRVRVTYTAGVGIGALQPSTYTFIAEAIPSFNPVVVSGRYVNGKGIIPNSLVELTLDNDLSPGLTYQVSISAFIGTPASNATFVAFSPNWPPTRSFDLWDTIPAINKSEDTTGDLERFILCIQDQLDTTLASIDNWVDILDPDRAREDYLDAMLLDLGNPFTFEALSENDKSLLVKVLVRIYQLKGTDQGIQAAIRFFMGFESQIDLFSQSGSLLSSTTVFFDLLNDSFVLGGGGPFDFSVMVAPNDPPGRALTASEATRIERIINVVKPAGTRFVKPIYAGLPAPARVQIAGTPSSVTVSWSQTAVRPDTWRIYYRLSNGGVTPFNTARNVEVAGTTYFTTITTPVGADPAGSSYFFVLVPHYNGLDGFHSEIEVRNNLVAPASVTAIGGPQKVTVSWASIAAATSYRVYKTLSTTNTSSTPVIADFVFDVLGGATSFVDTNMRPGQTAYYCVVARTGDSEGYYSISVAGTAI